MMTEHWTRRSIGDYLFFVVFDIIDQLGSRDRNHWNPRLKTLARKAQQDDMDMSVVFYAKMDRGPVSGHIFRECWESLGRPQSMLEIKDAFTALQEGKIDADS